ncbi:MAG: hypothetical protein KAV82_01330 [Phycisphaerae bacterium]|nr:hypothetical protein [Phycisphaerae bacterium]
MGFEFFTESGRGFRPRASIRKQGQIGLNQGAVRRFDLERWKYAVLGYDRENGLVALKLTNDETEQGVQRIVIKDGSASISARSFLEYFNIGYRDETKQYDASHDETKDMLIVSIGSAAKNGDTQGNLINE